MDTVKQNTRNILISTCTANNKYNMCRKRELEGKRVYEDLASLRHTFENLNRENI